MAMSIASMANPVIDNNNTAAGDDDLLLLHEEDTGLSPSSSDSHPLASVPTSNARCAASAENGGKRTISSSPSAPSTNARRSRTREVASRYMYRPAASSSQRYKSPTNNYASASAIARSPSPIWGRSSRSSSSAAAASQTPSSFYASTASMVAMTPSSSSAADPAADNMNKKSRPLSADRCRRRPYAAHAFESNNKTTTSANASAQTNNPLSSSRPSSLTKKRPSSACMRSETPSFATSLWPSAVQPSTASSVFSAIVHHHDGSVSAAARHGAQPLHPHGRRFSPQRRASSRVRMSTATLTSADHSLQSAACTLRASSTCTMMAAISSIAAAAATDQPCGGGGGGSCRTDSPWWPAVLPRTATANVVDATRRVSDGQRSESNGRRRPIATSTVEMDVDRHGLRGSSSRSNSQISSSEEARCAPADDNVDLGGSTKSNLVTPPSDSREDESGNRVQEGSPQFVRRGDGSGDEDASAALSDTESTSSGSMISLPSSSSDGSRAGARPLRMPTKTANSSSGTAVSVKMRGTVVPARFWQSDSASTSTTARAAPAPPLNNAASSSFSMANTAAARTVTPLRGLPTAHASAPPSPASPTYTPHLHPRKGGGARTQSPSRAVSATSPAKTRLLLMPNASSNGPAGAAGGGATAAAQRGPSMSSVVNMSLDLGKACSSRKSWGLLQQQLEEAHDLRLLHNRWLQWHFVNARAEHARKLQSATAEKLLYACFSTTCDLRMSVTSKQIQRNQALQALKLDSMLEANTAPLEEWASLQSGHSSALAGVMGALEAAVIRVPIIGTKIDIQATKEALCSAVDVMDALEAFVDAFLLKVEAVDTSLSELAKTIILEKASLMECGDLLAAATLLETEERSLRAYLMQIEPIQPRI